MKKETHIILPNIRSCFNVGAMFRTADACGIDKIWLTGYTPAPPDQRIAKVALGADTWKNFEKRLNLLELLAELKKDGFFLVALEKNNRSQELSSITYPEKTALIVGNEIDGVSEEAMALCDAIAHIPMHGQKESLNVSVAAGIAMYTLGNR